jgi:chorismate synthase
MKYRIFGESHGPAIGVVLEGLPSGVALDMEEIAFELSRRAPGRDRLSTARREADVPEILSGVFEGHTTGTPLCAVIPNTDQHSGDYDKLRYLPRPGHADYTGFMRYQGYNDYRGGGHFSGRLTAPLVFAGAVAKQILAPEGVTVGAHIRSIGGIEDMPFLNDETPLTAALLRELGRKDFPVLWDERGDAMQAEILKARSMGDSVGGTIECAVTGLPAGMGAPDFGENVEGIVSWHVFAVPGVKAGQRSTTVEELQAALSRHIEPSDSDGMEARQIKSMVEGMKAEARAYIAAGGSIVEYGRRLTERQDAEIAIYERTKAEIDEARKTMAEDAFLSLWEVRNDRLRNLGIKLVPLE